MSIYWMNGQILLSRGFHSLDFKRFIFIFRYTRWALEIVFNLFVLSLTQIYCNRLSFWLFRWISRIFLLHISPRHGLTSPHMYFRIIHTTRTGHDYLFLKLVANRRQVDFYMFYNKVFRRRERGGKNEIIKIRIQLTNISRSSRVLRFYIHFFFSSNPPHPVHFRSAYSQFGVCSVAMYKRNDLQMAARLEHSHLSFRVSIATTIRISFKNEF